VHVRHKPGIELHKKTSEQKIQIGSWQGSNWGLFNPCKGGKMISKAEEKS
jgi:hypothetical protein